MSGVSYCLCLFIDQLFVNLCPLELDRFPFSFFSRTQTFSVQDSAALLLIMHFKTKNIFFFFAHLQSSNDDTPLTTSRLYRTQSQILDLQPSVVL